jgi:protein-tyrosine phosphatase
MIDLHTHLLPEWDDGAADGAEAERMIRVAREDGISKIVLTPHVFRRTKHGINDGRDLKIKIRAFIEQSRSYGIDFFPGAEVRVHTEMIAHIKDFDLTINGSAFVFIEFPAEHLPAGASNLVYQMMLEGLIPIISHPERNPDFARSPENLYELVKQGAIGQVTAQSITGGFGAHARKAAEKFLRHGLVHLIASDAHNADDRPPRLSEAVEIAARYVGRTKAEAMVTTVPAAILDNEQIPDFGEPISPVKKGKLHFLSR